MFSNHMIFNLSEMLNFKFHMPNSIMMPTMFKFFDLNRLVVFISNYRRNSIRAIVFWNFKPTTVVFMYSLKIVRFRYESIFKGIFSSKNFLFFSQLGLLESLFHLWLLLSLLFQQLSTFDSIHNDIQESKNKSMTLNVQYFHVFKSNKNEIL